MTINIEYKLLRTTKVSWLMILYNYVGFVGGEKGYNIKRNIFLRITWYYFKIYKKYKFHKLW